MSNASQSHLPFISSPGSEDLAQFCLFVPSVDDRQKSPKAESDATVDSQVQPTRYFRLKPIVDRTIAALVMSVALPLMGLVALFILVLDGRPVLYRQVRVGKGGRTFRIWKFRTMHTDAERLTGPVWAGESDPRVTRLGRRLRHLHLDELPQLFNVLAGDMNLIGPRPERPEFVQELARELPDYSQRITVRPGMTGLAQLELGYDQSLADVRAKVLLDLQYIASAHLGYDLWLLLRTIPYLLFKSARKMSVRTKRKCCPAAGSHGKRGSNESNRNQYGDVGINSVSVLNREDGDRRRYDMPGPLLAGLKSAPASLNATLHDH